MEEKDLIKLAKKLKKEKVIHSTYLLVITVDDDGVKKQHEKTTCLVFFLAFGLLKSEEKNIYIDCISYFSVNPEPLVRILCTLVCRTFLCLMCFPNNCHQAPWKNVWLKWIKSLTLTWAFLGRRLYPYSRENCCLLHLQKCFILTGDIFRAALKKIGILLLFSVELAI